MASADLSYAKSRRTGNELIGKVNLNLALTNYNRRLNLTKTLEDFNINGNIYIGGNDVIDTRNLNFTEAFTCKVLEEYNITHIINLHGTYKLRDFVTSKCGINSDNYQLIQVCDDDGGQDIKHFFNGTNDFIQKALEEGGNIFVHCYAGVTRSSSIIVAYLMKTFGITYLEGIKEVKSARRLTKHYEGEFLKNPFFREQLKEYQDELGILSVQGEVDEILKVNTSEEIYELIRQYSGRDHTIFYFDPSDYKAKYTSKGKTPADPPVPFWIIYPDKVIAGSDEKENPLLTERSTDMDAIKAGNFSFDTSSLSLEFINGKITNPDIFNLLTIYGRFWFWFERKEGGDILNVSHGEIKYICEKVI